jgi:hypothetical protein
MMEPIAEIKHLYYHATRASIERDLARAVDLLKSLPEDERERAAVFMDGLSQMRSEWAPAAPPAPAKAAGTPARAGRAKKPKASGA